MFRLMCIELIVFAAAAIGCINIAITYTYVMINKVNELERAHIWIANRLTGFGPWNLVLGKKFLCYA